MATNINWFVIWVPSASEERRDRKMTSPLKEEEEQREEDMVPEESAKSSLSRKSSKFAVTSVDERTDGDGDTRMSKTASKFEVTSIEDPHDGDREPSLSRTPSKVSKFSVSKVDVSSDQPQSRQGSVTTLALDGEDTEDGDEGPENENNKTVKHIKELETQQSVEDILELETMEDIVKRLLAGRNIRDLHIVSSADSKQTQISFCVGLDQVEDLLLELQRNGIGQAEQVQWCSISLKLPTELSI